MQPKKPEKKEQASRAGKRPVQVFLSQDEHRDMRILCAPVGMSAARFGYLALAHFIRKGKLPPHIEE